MAQESFSGIEVDAPHFNKIIGHLNYKFYSLNERNIPGFPKIGNRIDIPLDQYSHCCQWIEEKLKNSTRIFFFTQNEKTAENIKNNLLEGKDTKDILPLIQNNYGKKGGNVFNNIAVCGDIVRSKDWEIDRVKRIKAKKDKKAKKDNVPLNKKNFNKDKGFVYHVTNVPADHQTDDPPSSEETIPKDNNGEEWNEIKSKIANKYNYNYHPKISLKVCFVSSTLYNNSLPTITTYPFNVDSGGVNYYKRIKLPFEDISKRIVTNVKGQLHEEFSKIFYLSSTFSQVVDDPSNNVTQVHYICGFNTEEIKEYLESVFKIKVVLKEDAVKLINEDKVDNIIGIPKEEILTAQFNKMSLE